MADDFDRDQPSEADPAYIGWRRVLSYPVETRSDAERAMREAFALRVGASPSAQQNATQEGLTALTARKGTSYSIGLFMWSISACCSLAFSSRMAVIVFS